MKESLADAVVLEYLGGASAAKIGLKYKINPSSVRNVLCARGVPRRSLSESHRVYSLDERAFDVLNEKTCYWLGFLMADGYIRVRRKSEWTVHLCLAEKDRKHLLRFRKFVGSTHRMVPRVSGFGRNYIEFKFCSMRIAQVLGSYGVVPRKNTDGTKVLGLEDDRHFWRGYVDGNGSLGIYEDRPDIQVTGPELLLEQFVTFIRKAVPRCRATVRPVKGTFKVATTGSTAAEIIADLYGNCSIALPRKYRIAKEISGEIPRGDS